MTNMNWNNDDALFQTADTSNASRWIGWRNGYSSRWMAPTSSFQCKNYEAGTEGY